MALPLLSAIPILGTVLDKAVDLFQGDDKRQAELLREQIQNGHLQVMGQLEINANEAKHQSLFVAGWRPFIGWTCGVALVFSYIIRPCIFPFLYGSFPELRDVPAIDDVLWELMFGLLGMAGLRSLDKRKK